MDTPRSVPQTPCRLPLLAAFLAAALLALTTSNAWPSPGNFQPRIAHNSVRNEYLQVYHYSDGSNHQLLGQLLDETGQPLSGSAAFPISEIDGSIGYIADSQTQYDVAYDSLHDRYLVVWTPYDNTDVVSYVRGQLVSAAGDLLAPSTLTACTSPCATPSDYDFTITSLSGVEEFGQVGVAFDRINGHFLVTWDRGVGNKLVTIDKTDASLHPVGVLGVDDTVRGMAFHPTSGTLYAVTDNADELFTIDTATGAATQVAALTMPAEWSGIPHVQGLAFKDDNTLYGASYYYTSSYDVYLGTIDLVTSPGTITHQATKTLAASAIQSLAHDATDSAFYAVIGGYLVSIDDSTYAWSSAIGPGGIPTMVGLDFDPEGTLYGITYDGNLVTIDTSAGTTSTVGDTGLGNNALQALAIDASGVLYAVTGDRDLFGQLVGAKGDLLLPGTFAQASTPGEGRITISSALGGQSSSSVAFEPVSRRFLVVWVDSRENPTVNISRIYGQLVSAAGAPAGADTGVNFAIQEANTFPGSEKASVAAAPGEGFLVVWMDPRNTGTGVDIYGHLVGTDGTLIDAAGAGAGADLPISLAVNAQDYPHVAFNPASGRYLATWRDFRAGVSSTYDTYGQQVEIDGTLIDHAGNGTPESDNLKLSTTTAGQYYRHGDVAANPFCGNYLVATETYDLAYDVGTVATAACTPDPALAWPNATIGPTTGVSGENVTASVVYYSASNTAPTVAQVWADLDGDGQFSDSPVVISSVTPVHGGTLPPASGLAAVAGLGALLLGAVLLAWRQPRHRPAWITVSGILVVWLGLTIGLVGCNSSSGGGGGTEEPPPTEEEPPPLTLPERYDLQPADASDTDYTDGATYTITVPTAGAARTVTFKFVFSDGTKSAVGNPAEEHTFTLTAP